MSGSYTFIIVGKRDTPLYELEYSSSATKKEDSSHLNQFIIFAALDVVDEQIWGANQMYLKVVDKFNDQFVSALVTAGHLRFMMLHDVRNDDGIRNFCQEVYEIYLKVLLNPFYEVNTPITSPVFDQKVRVLARKYL